MGDGSWLPVRKVFLGEVTQAVPDLVEYMRRVFPSALQDIELSPPTPRGDVREKLAEEFEERPDEPGPSHRLPEKQVPSAGDQRESLLADTKDDDVRTLAVTGTSMANAIRPGGKWWLSRVAVSSAIGPIVSMPPPGHSRAHEEFLAAWWRSGPLEG